MPCCGCLSPYVRFGLISLREVYWAAQGALEHARGEEAGQLVMTWVNELIWREFYVQCPVLQFTPPGKWIAHRLAVPHRWSIMQRRVNVLLRPTGRW